MKYRPLKLVAPVAALVAAVVGAAVVGTGHSAPAAKPGAGVTIGYAGLSSQFPFVADVNRGLEAAAKKAGAKLIILDNKYDPQVALTNAETLIQRKATVIIEFQTDQSIAPALCQKFDGAGLGKKVIAIDIPHPPCAVFFGANNRRAGAIAGFNLARIAKKQWGKIDRIVLLALPQSGKLVVSRTDGYVDGARRVFPNFSDSKVIKVDGKGNIEDSLKVMQNVLARLPRSAKVLVGAVNDPSALGAERAIQAAGRDKNFLIGGQNATIEARAEICNNSALFVGSVGYFPERYGDKLVPLAIKLSKGQTTARNVYIDHVWIDNKNIRNFYPNC
jgi:ribose transport system substrate-binding protein